MKRLTIIPLFLFFVHQISFGQFLRMELINKKTEQFLKYYKGGGGKNCINYFSLISKNNNCEVKYIKIVCSETNNFIDSLKKNGFTSKIKFIDRQKEYNVKIELLSFRFDSYWYKNGDSLFQFVYKINLKEIKSNNVFTKLDTIYGTEKIKVLNSIYTTNYKIKIEEIKGTSIIRVELYSEDLLYPFKDEKYKTARIFFPYNCYYYPAGRDL